MGPRYQRDTFIDDDLVDQAKLLSDGNDNNLSSSPDDKKYKEMSLI